MGGFDQLVDVCYHLESWSQVVIDHGQGGYQAKEIRFRDLVLKKMGGGI